MSVTKIRRTLEEDIRKVDEKIAFLTRQKEAAIEELLKEKEALEREHPSMRSALNEIDAKVEEINEEKRVLQGKHDLIHKEFKPFEQLAASLTHINTELATIEARHEEVRTELSTRKSFLLNRLKSILVVDDLQSTIKAKVREQRNDLNEALKNAENERKALLAREDLTPSQMEANMMAIDKKIKDLEIQNIEVVAGLDQEITDAMSNFSSKSSYARHLIELKQGATPSQIEHIDQALADLNVDLEHMEGSITLSEIVEKRRQALIRQQEIEKELANLLDLRENATPSQLVLINQKIAELNAEMETVKKIIELHPFSSKEEMAQILKKRGLTWGHITTASGRILTLGEVKALGLFDGLEDDLMQIRGIHVTTSGRIRTDSGNLYTRSEAEDLGLLFGINLEEMYDWRVSTESTTTTTASDTILSGMTSSDVHYLKTTLGRPLALALAEILAKRPRDPVHYLGHWLYKYRYNQEYDEERKKEIADLQQERQRLADIELRERAEEEAKEAVKDLVERVDVAIKKLDADADWTVDWTRIEDDAGAEAHVDDLEEEAKDTLGVYDGPTNGQKLK